MCGLFINSNNIPSDLFRACALFVDDQLDLGRTKKFITLIRVRNLIRFDGLMADVSKLSRFDLPGRRCSILINNNPPFYYNQRRVYKEKRRIKQPFIKWQKNVLRYIYRRA